ncbi:Replicase polyprotein 1ab [Bienertia sinuspersici]
MSKAEQINVTSPLYLHPSDDSKLIVFEVLIGSSNYRSWRRSMEVALASKRKLVISWIMGNVSPPLPSKYCSLTQLGIYGCNLKGDSW